MATEKEKNGFTRVEVSVFMKWVWYFIKYYENMDEVEFLMTLFNYYLTQEPKNHFGELQLNTQKKLVNFLASSFFISNNTSFGSYFGGMTMENVTTSINEC